MINELNKKYLKFSSNWENKPIVESMISYYGTPDSSQQINKSRFGWDVKFGSSQRHITVQFSSDHAKV